MNNTMTKHQNANNISFITGCLMNGTVKRMTVNPDTNVVTCYPVCGGIYIATFGKWDLVDASKDIETHMVEDGTVGNAINFVSNRW